MAVVHALDRLEVVVFEPQTDVKFLVGEFIRNTQPFFDFMVDDDHGDGTFERLEKSTERHGVDPAVGVEDVLRQLGHGIERCFVIGVAMSLYASKFSWSMLIDHMYLANFGEKLSGDSSPCWRKLCQ